MCLPNVKLYSYELSFYSVKDVLLRGGVAQFSANRREGSLSFFAKVWRGRSVSVSVRYRFADPSPMIFFVHSLSDHYQTIDWGCREPCTTKIMSGIIYFDDQIFRITFIYAVYTYLTCS